MDTTLLSVVIDEEKTDKVCFFIVGEVKAAKCKYWTYHCTAAAREVKKETVEMKKIKKGWEKQVKVIEKKADKKDGKGCCIKKRSSSTGIFEKR